MNLAMSEKQFEKKCVELALFYGWFERKCEWIGRRGCPDRLFIKDGRHVFVEFKRPDGTGAVAELQLREHERLEAAGAEVFVVETYAEFRAALRIESPDDGV